MLKKHLLFCLLISEMMAACSTSSGPMFSAYSVDLRGESKAYQVDCGGAFGRAAICVKVAKRICGDQQVRIIQATDALRSGNVASNPHSIVFECGEPKIEPKPEPKPVPTPSVKQPSTSVELRGDANFIFDRADLTSTAVAVLDEFINENKNKVFRNISINGYTDSVGSFAYNQLLSQRRAYAVLSFLKSRGLRSDVFEARGFGSNDPVAPNTDPEGRARNRRVTIMGRYVGFD